MANERTIPTLQPDDIEVKIKQITGKGALGLLYKTSRTDMRILDEVYGVNNWQISYQMIGDMLFCTISIWDEEKKQWISKQSNGIESREDGEGNEKKGWSSDGCKRAGFMLGIGRELYTAPFTWLKVETEQDKNGKWQLKDRFAKFVVSDIDYDNKRKIIKLVIINQSTGEVVFSYGANARKSAPQKKPEPQNADAPQSEPPKAVTPPPVNATMEKVNTAPPIDGKEIPTHEKVVNDFLARHHIDKKQFAALRVKAIKAGKPVSAKKFTELTPDEYIGMCVIMDGLFEEGFFKEAS